MGVMYIVGLLYTIPITRREGFTAIFEPERADGCDYYEPIELIYPTPFHTNIFIVLTGFTVLAFGVGPVVLSVVFYNRGDFEASKFYQNLPYALGIPIYFSLGYVFLYYGVKFTRIIKTNIIRAETRLGIPYTRFGLTNLLSKSPARYLFIMQQITVFGALAVEMVITFFLSSYMLLKDRILSAKQGLFSHCYALVWTCALPSVGAVQLALVHVQLIRNKRMRQRLTGLYGPIEDKESCPGFDTDLDLVRDPVVGDQCAAREMDLRFLTLDCEIDDIALRTHTWRSTHYASSSGSDPVSSTVREYIRHFSSEGVTTLPTSAMMPPGIHYVPSSMHCDVRAREYVMPSLLETASQSTENISLEQPLESGVHLEARAQSHYVVTYNSSQKATPDLGHWQD